MRYAVHEVLSKGTCRLSQVKKPNKVLAQKFNISQLKLYHQDGFFDNVFIFCALKSYFTQHQEMSWTKLVNHQI